MVNFIERMKKDFIEMTKTRKNDTETANQLSKTMTDKINRQTDGNIFNGKIIFSRW